MPASSASSMTLASSADLAMGSSLASWLCHGISVASILALGQSNASSPHDSDVCFDGLLHVQQQAEH